MIYLGNCIDKEYAQIASKCTKRLNKRTFHRLLKQQYPEMFNSLGLEFYNPYNYYQSKKYFVLTHSMIEYVFLKEGETI